MNEHETSSLVRCQDPDNNEFDEMVYHLTSSGDIGTKQHLNMTYLEFKENGYDEDSIYTINMVDRDMYILGDSIL